MAKTQITLNAVGDIALFASIQERYFNHAINPLTPVASLLGNCDYLLGNFEFPFTDHAKPGMAEAYKGYLVKPESASILKAAPFNLLSLATNHCLDWGLEGIRCTQSTLRSLGIDTIGAGADLEDASRSIVIDIHGIRLGISAYCKLGLYTASRANSGANPLKKKHILKDIENLRSRVDHIVLLLHWGVEFSDYPTPEDVSLGHALIDAGASIIIGSHAHVIQGVEHYHNGIIYYGLGNFVYDPQGERIFVDTKITERKECLIAKVTLNKSSIIKDSIIPCTISDSGQTIPLKGESADRLVARVSKISQEIGNSNLFYATAGANLVGREIRTHLYYLKRDKFQFIWRLIKNFKVRHLKIAFGYLRTKITSPLEGH